MHLFKKRSKPKVTPFVELNTNNQIISNGDESQSIPTYSSVSIPKPIIIPRKANCCEQCCTKENLKEQALLLATIISVVLGVAVGIALRGLKCPGGKINPQIIYIRILYFISRWSNKWMSYN